MLPAPRVTLPLTCNFVVGFVVPIPTLLDVFIPAAYVVHCDEVPPPPPL